MFDMKKKLIKILVGFVSVFVFLIGFCSVPVFAAECGGAETSIIECGEDEGGVWHVLSSVIDILTIGVAILGLIGILVVGIQILTSKDNAEQSKKARVRLLGITIGLALYAVMFAGIKFLMPVGLEESQERLSGVGTTAQIRELEEAQEEARKNATPVETETPTRGGSGSSGSGSGSGSSAVTGKTKDFGNENLSWGEKIAIVAEELAWPYGTPESLWKYTGPMYGNNFKSWDDLEESGSARPNKAYQQVLDMLHPDHGWSSMPQLGADCGYFVVNVLRYSGHDTKMKYGQADSYYTSSKKWEKVSKAKRGDVCTWHSGNGFHTRIYLGDGYSAEAGHHSQRFGQIVKGGCGSYAVYRPLDF